MKNAKFSNNFSLKKIKNLNKNVKEIKKYIDFREFNKC